jgi:hypothetical protein
MVVTADKRGAELRCDGHSIAARPCLNTLELGWGTGVPRSQADAEKQARRQAKGKGWTTTEGEDRCPRLHADDKAKRR